MQRSWRGLKNLVLFAMHHCQASELVGLAGPPQEPHPAFGLWPRFSALRASFGSLFQQSSFPPMHPVLIKTLVVSIFGAKECTRMQDFVLKIYKRFRGSRPRTPAAEGETFVRTHPVPTCQMLVSLRFF